MKRLLLIALLTLSLSAASFALPLASFSAVGQSRQVRIQWELTSPEPVAQFVLTRNGLSAMRIPAEFGQLNYEWVDSEVQNDRPYAYGLVAVMNDGTREQLGTVSATPAYDAAIVREFKLNQNFPNPFNPETTIEVELAEDGMAELTVFDVLGQEVAKPLAGILAHGRYSVLFNGRDLPSGVYFYQLRAGNFVDQKKMVLLK